MSGIDALIDRLSDRQRREFALWCAERVRHLMTDSRSTNALDVAARHLRGEATDEELDAARAAATAAWDVATDDEMAAARAAAAAALVAWDAAAAALASVWATAWEAVRNAVRFAAWEAARDAERAAQRTELERMLGEVKS